MRQGFRSLTVYRRAGVLADELHGVALTWPSFDRWSIGLQMVRAADSVGANIAEADGRFGPADQRRLLFMARGSVCELEHWLERAAGRRLSTSPDATEAAHEIARMLNGLIRRLPHH
jgi:four helix bundle protein